MVEGTDQVPKAHTTPSRIALSTLLVRKTWRPKIKASTKHNHDMLNPRAMALYSTKGPDATAKASAKQTDVAVEHGAHEEVEQGQHQHPGKEGRQAQGHPIDTEEAGGELREQCVEDVVRRVQIIGYQTHRCPACRTGRTRRPRDRRSAARAGKPAARHPPGSGTARSAGGRVRCACADRRSASRRSPMKPADTFVLLCRLPLIYPIRGSNATMSA